MKGWIYIEIRKGVYGLPQVGSFANKKLTKHLAKYGYHPTKLTPGLWKYKVNLVQLTLTVDDFFIKHIDQKDVEHLISALKYQYEI